jgi:hypothetical protein
VITTQNIATAGNVTTTQTVETTGDVTTTTESHLVSLQFYLQLSHYFALL